MSEVRGQGTHTVNTAAAAASAGASAMNSAGRLGHRH